ncbi:MAG: CvpA family protein [Candidatus Cloacimonetes bacterium]|jgi:membrane protein required for colicin V production|nr:CvpA family protein [Candidatus Cloacimonadota bacterium]MDD4100261.1 CvpA family protein [Candidatus Cloacimonadota bacterium]MDD4805945.1 CvpA family protein [Candidatus Cloacimonadota bacterium]
MGIIDWIILAFLLFFTFNGYRRGLAGAIIQLAGFVLAFFLIGHYYPLLANQLMLKYAMSKGLATVIAVILILILLVVITRFVIWAIDRFIKALKLSGMNRFLGAVLGLVNGLICVIIITVALDYLPKVSTPLKDGEKHRVYAGIEVLKEDLFDKLQLENRMKYIKMPKIPFTKDKPED